MTVFDWHNTSWDLRPAPPRLAILPIGAMEQYGPHLPVGTENLILDVVARRVAHKLEQDCYLLPTVPLGNSPQHRGCAGTISLSWRTLSHVVTDLVVSLRFVGVRRVAVLVGLGGAACTTVMPRGNEIVKTAVRRLNYDHPDMDVIWVQPLTVAEPHLDRLFEAPEHDVHAGEVVTSIMMHLYPEMVGEPVADWVPAEQGRYMEALHFTTVCPDGVWGCPSLADAESGALALDAAVGGTVAYIEETFAQVAQIKRCGDCSHGVRKGPCANTADKEVD